MRRALRGRRTRVALTTIGMAGSTLLVLVLFAAQRSVTTSVAAYAGQPEIDLWIAPRGTDNLIRSGGFLPADREEALREVPGVARVDTVLRSFVSVTADGDGDGDGARRRPLTLLVIGQWGAKGLGGPPSMFDGRRASGPGEVVLDRAAAFRLGVSTGGHVMVQGRRLLVTGLSRGTNLIATQFLFADYGEVEDALGTMGRASFLVAKLDRDVDPAAAARRVASALPECSVLTRAEFVANNQREVSAGFAPLLVLLTLVGVGVAATLVALLAQGLVEDRRADIAVLFALGVSPSAVALGVLAQVGSIVIGSGAVGTALAFAVASGLDRLLPTVELTYRAQDVALALALALGAGLLSALAPVVRLQDIDPLLAFRA